MDSRLNGLDGILLAQANVPNSQASPVVKRLVAPSGPGALVIKVEPGDTIDFRGIADQRIVIVRAGDRLVILFEDDRSIVLQGYFGPDGEPTSGTAVIATDQGPISPQRFAELFPISDDPSVLPAAGPASLNPSSSAPLLRDPVFQARRGLEFEPSDLLQNERFANERFRFGEFEDDSEGPISTIPPGAFNATLTLRESDTVVSGSELGGVFVVNGKLDYNFGTEGPGGNAIRFDVGAIPPMSADGLPVTFQWDAISNTLIAETSRGPVFSLRITDPSSGAYEASLFGNFDHLGANGSRFTLALPFTVTSSLGNSASSEIVLTITDDGPTAGAAQAGGVVEASAETFTSSFAVGSLNIRWGADQSDDTDGVDNSVVPGSNRSLAFVGTNSTGAVVTTTGIPLTSNGFAVTVETGVEANGSPVLTGRAGNTVVFRLVLNDDGSGSYRFELLDNLDHTGANNVALVLNFGIRVSDSDGDTIDTLVSIAIRDALATPILGKPEGGAIDEDGGLVNGNAGGIDDHPNALTTTRGSLSIDWGADDANPSKQGAALGDRALQFNDEVLNDLAAMRLSSQGIPLEYAIEHSGTVLTAVAGDVTVFVVSLSDADDGSFLFELLASLDHRDMETEDELKLSFWFVATDSDGDTAFGRFNVSIDDDSPVTLENRAATLDDDALTGGNAGGAGDVSPDSTNITGRLGHGLGADGGRIGWLTNGAPDGFSYALDGTMLQVRQGDTLVLTLTLDAATGDYTIRQNAAIRHADGQAENDQAFRFAYRVTDGDGDTADGVLDLTVNDDSPVTLENRTATLDDDALIGGNAGGAGDVSPDSTNITGRLGHGLGADGGRIGWLTNGAPDGFSYVLDGTTLQVRQGDTLVLTLTLDAATGDYTIRQNAAIRHVDGQVENDQAFRFAYRVTDGDGDTADGVLDLTVNDDTPVSGRTALLELNDDIRLDPNANFLSGPLPINASFGADGGVFSWLTTGAPAGFSYAINASEPLRLDVYQQEAGADQTGDVPVLIVTIDRATGSYTVLQNAAIRHATGAGANEQAFTFAFRAMDGDLDSADGTISVTVVDDLPEIPETNAAMLLDDDALANGNKAGVGDRSPDTVHATGTLSHGFGGDGGSIGWLTTGAPEGFSYILNGTALEVRHGTTHILTLLLDPATGAYSATQHAAIMHPAGADENETKFTFSYRVTDRDGDTVDGTLGLTVNDDTPVWTGTRLTWLTQEANIDTANSLGSFAAVDGRDGNYATAHFNLKQIVSFGADGAAAFSIVADALPWVQSLELTSQGEAVSAVTHHSNGFIAKTAAGRAVFRVDLDFVGGGFDFVLLDGVDHPEGGGDQAFDLSSLVTAHDRDGDPLSFAPGTVVVAFSDDGIRAVNDAASGNEDSSALTVNLLANDSGADLAKSVEITNVAYAPGATSATGSGGTYTLDPATGVLRFTPAANWNGTATFTYRVTDHDGDSAEATASFTIGAVNDAPVFTPYEQQLINQGFVKNASNGNFYKFFSGNYTISEAMANAKSFNGHLVDIQDSSENQFVAGLLLPHPGSDAAKTWLALSDALVEGDWRFIDGPSNGGTPTFFRWHGGEPNNQFNEDFVTMDWSGNWNDYGDQQRAGYVVEISSSNVGSSTINQPASISELTDASAQDIAPVTGSLSVTDVDVGNPLTAYTNVAPVLQWSGGSLSESQLSNLTSALATGRLTFTGANSNGGVQTLGYSWDPSAANLDFLAQGQTLRVTYQVRVFDGGLNSGPQPLTFTIAGTNDAPTANNFQLVTNVTGNTGFSTGFTGWTILPGPQTGPFGERISSGYTYSARIDTTQSLIPGDATVADLSFGGWLSSYRDGPVIGTAYGPSLISDTFAGRAGDLVKFEYRAFSGADAASITAQLINTSTNAIIPVFFEQTPAGVTGPVKQASIPLAADGTYKIEFKVGSFDASDGGFIGARLAIGTAGIVRQGVDDGSPQTFEALQFLNAAADKDSGAVLSLASVDAISALGASVSINAAGNVVYSAQGAGIAALALGETATDTFRYTIVDQFGASSTATASVLVTGRNDAPTLGTLAALTFNDTSADDTFVSAIGQLAGEDVDGDTLTYGITGGTATSNTVDGVTYTRFINGTYGRLLVVDSGADAGKYRYEPNDAAIEALRGGASESFTFTASDGMAVASTVLTINLAGANDTPTISGDLARSVNEDDSSTISGVITVSDRDAGVPVIESYSSGRPLGTLTINSTASGSNLQAAWFFKLEPAAQALNAGESRVETFGVRLFDGPDFNINFTVNGENDTPTFSGNATGTVNEDGITSYSGSLAALDPDAGQSGFQPQTDIVGAFGTLSIDATGAWTYTLDNTLASVQALGIGETLSDLITVRSVDNTATQIAITISGTNDAPTLQAVAAISYADTSADDTFAFGTGRIVAADVDGDTLTFGIQGGVATNVTLGGVTYTRAFVGAFGTMHVVASGADAGKYHFEPNDAAIEALKTGATENFTFTVTDGTATTTTTLTVNLSGANDTPEFVLGTPHFSGLEDGGTGDGTFVASDRDGDAVTVSVATQGALGTATVTGPGTFSYAPNAHASGQDLFWLSFSDSAGHGGARKVTVDLAPVADAPTIDITQPVPVLARNKLVGANVAVFDNANFVDTNNDFASESDTIQASLRALGHNVLTFTGIDSGSLAGALAGKSVLVVPELEYSALQLSTEAANVLRQFVQNGGTLVISGQSEDRDEAFLNATFGFNLQSHPRTYLGYDGTAARDGTTFADDGASVGSVTAVYGIRTNSLPTGALSLYQKGSETVVAAMPYGSGQIISLGFDWYNAAPTGPANGGWLNLLDSAISAVGIGSQPVGATLSGTEDAPFSLGTISAISPDPSETVALTLSGFPAGGTFSIGTANGDGTWSIPANLLAGLATTPLSFTPPASYNGTFTLSVTATSTDTATLSTGVSTSTASTTKTLDVTVQAMNDAPRLEAVEALTYADTSANDTFVASTGQLTAADIDGDALTFGIQDGVATNTIFGAITYTALKTGTYGTLLVVASGADAGKYHFEPNDAAIEALKSGASETFTFTVNDGTATTTTTLTVNLTGANDTPEFALGTTHFSVQEDGGNGNGNGNGTFVASDRDGDAVTVSVATQGTLGTATVTGPGTFSYAPNAHASGQDSFTLAYTDGASGGSRNVTVDLAPVADAPVLVLGAEGSVTPMPMTGEFLVNSTTFQSQAYQSVATLKDGKSVLMWASFGEDGSGWGLFGRLYDAAGAALGTPFPINQSTAGHQYPSDLAALSGGGFVAVWTDEGRGDVVARRFDANGTALGDEFRVNSTVEQVQTYSDVTALADGGFVIAWGSYAQDGSGWGVYGQRFNVAGAATGAEFRINNYTNADQDIPALAGLPNGGFVAVWQSAGQDGMDRGVYGRIYDNAGTPGVEFGPINTYTISNQSTPEVIVTSDGGFVVAWSSQSQIGEGYEVYAQIFSSSGTRVGSEFRLNEHTALDQISPALLALPDGGFIASWSSLGQDSANWGFFGRRFDASGNPTSPDVRFNETESGLQFSDVQLGGNPLALLPNGDIIATWYGQGTGDSSGQGVFARRFDIGFAPQGTEDAPFSLGTISAISPDPSETVALTLSGFPAGGTFSIGTANGDGTWSIPANLLAGLATTPLSFTPPASYNGTFTLSVTATSTDTATLSTGVSTSTASTTKTLDVTVQAVNDAPRLEAVEALTYADTSANDTFVASTGQLAAADIDGDALTFGIQDGVATNTIFGAITYTALKAGTYGTLMVVASGADAGKYRFEPNDAAIEALKAGASETFTFTVSDGTATATTTLTVNLSGANDTPEVVLGTPHFIGLEDGGAGNGTFVASDRDGDAVIVSVATQGTLGTATVTGPGTFSYAPNAHASGQDSFTLAFTDGASGGSRSVTVDLAPVADAPALTLSAASDTPTPVAGEFRVNTYTADAQLYPAVAVLKDGKSVIMWASVFEDGHGWGMYGQTFDAAGAPLGAPFRFNQTTAYNQFWGDITALPDGGFVATWANYRTTDANGNYIYDIVTRRYDANAAPIGNEVFITDSASFTRHYGDIATLADGGYVIVWSSLGQDGYDYGVYGQRFNAAGQKAGSEFRLNAYTTDTQWFSSVAALPSGGFVAIWESTGQDGDGYGVFGRLYDAAGNAGAEFGPINSTIVDSQRYSDVVSLNDGRFLVAWSSFDQSGSAWNIFAQMFDESGARVGNEFRVNTYLADQQWMPTLVALPDGGFIASWSSEGQEGSEGQDGSSAGVFGQRFDADGKPVGTEFRLNETMTGRQDNSPLHAGNTMVVLPNGDLLAAWDGNGNGDNTGVFARRFSLKYGAEGTEDAPISLGTIAAISPDPSETVALTLSGYPAGGTFSIGAASAGGTWSIPANLVAGIATTPLTFTPPANWNGSFKLSVTATSTDTATLSTGVSTSTAAMTKTLDVTVKAVNDAPGFTGAVTSLGYADTAANDTFNAATGQLTASDIDSATLTYGITGGIVTSTPIASINYTLMRAGTYGTLYVVASGADAGKYRFEPNDVAIEALKAGASETFTFTVTDGTATTTTTITVNLSGANDTPEFVLGTPHFSGLEDGGTGNGTFVASDRDGDAVTVSVATQGALGTATVTGPGAFSYTPAANASGQDFFWLRFSDGSADGARKVTIDLAPVADAPTLVLEAEGGATPTPLGAETLVNTFASNSQNTFSGDGQTYPSVLSLPNGGYVVAWSSVSHPGDGNWRSVHFQRFDAAGNKLGVETQMNTFTTDQQDVPSLAAIPNGGFVAVWQSAGAQDGSGYGIFARRYDANGTAIDAAEWLVNTSTSSDQTEPTVATLGDGGFVVLWQSWYQDGSFWGVYAQRFDSSGQRVGTEIRLNTTTAGFQSYPAVAAMSDSGFAAVWASENVDGSGLAVMLRRYDGSGNPLSGEITVNSFTSSDQSQPAIARLANGNFVVSWQSSNQDGSTEGVYAQLFQADGTRLGTETRVTTHTANEQRYPGVTALPDGGYLVVWSSWAQDGDNWGQYAQRFDASGNKLGDEFRINQTTTGEQSAGYPPNGGYPLATLTNGDVVAVTQGNGPGDSFGIFARRFSLSYNPQGNEDSTISLGTITAISPDPSETVALTLSGFPAGGTFSVGAASAGGTWSIPANLVAGLATTPLSFTPPANWNGTFTLSVTATSTDTAILSIGSATSTATTVKTLAVTVNAVNDVPTFAGQSTGTVTEDGTLTASGTATVTDADAGESAFRPQTGITGTYGTLDISAAGAWTYTLANSNAAVQALNAGQTLTDTVTVRSVDNTATDIAITINGANDNTAPVFRTVANQIAGQGFIQNGPSGNYYKAVSGAFTFAQAIAGADALKGHLVAIGDSAENTFVRNLANASGLQVAWIGLSDQKSEGSWRQLYGNAPLSFTNWLAGEPNDAGGIEDAAFMFVSNLGPPPGLWADDSDLRSVNVFGNLGYIIEVENTDTSFAAPAVFYADTSADDTFAPITGRLSATDAQGDALTYGFTGSTGPGGTFDGVTYTYSQAGSFGTLYLVASGADAGKYRFVPNDSGIEAIASGTSTAAFSFTVTDGLLTTTANLGLNMVVTGVNDPAAISGQTTGAVTEDGITSVSGTLSVVDRDASQSSFQAQSGLAGTYGTLNINTAGSWSYFLNNALASVQALNAGQTISDSVTVRSADGTAQNIAITINGANEPLSSFTWTTAGAVTTTANSAVISSDGTGENADTQLQTFLGMSTTVDAAIARNAFDGSAIKTTVSVGSSQFLKFTYSFAGNDAGSGTYADTSFITINGAATILKQFPGAASNVTFSRALTAGANTIGFASVDVGDSSVGATLTLSNIRIGSAADPIVLDLDRDGIRLTGETAFDLDNNGEAERIGWAKAGDAVLVMDLDGSGKIENGNEVVADHFMGLGFGDSLDALAFLDGNLDGRVDLSDEAFGRLRAWNDANANGTTEDGELISLAAIGITGIEVGAERVSRELDGHQVFGEGQVLYADGTMSTYLAVDFLEVGGGGQSDDAAFAPDTSGLDMRLALAEVENGAALSLGRA